MSGRSRFKIPTGEEMEKPASDAPSINTMSKFQTYKQQKKDIPSITKSNSKTDSSKSPVKAHIKPCTTTAQKPGTVFNGVVEKPPSLFVGTKQTIAVNAKQQQTSKPIGNKPVPSSVVPKGENSTSEKIAGNDTESTATGSSKAPSVNSIVVNFRQRGNPILKHIRNVPWEYGSIIPDYVMGKANCALFLSLRYHQLNPTYIHNRLKELGKGYDLRVLLVQVDVTEPHHLLKDLAKMCILADCTLIVAFTVEEAGRYLETYKVYENKPAEALMERIDTDYVSKLTDTLTSVRSVNKTDCMTLLSTFGSYDKMVKATKEELSLCPGFGPQKAQRLYDVFHEPFVKGRKRKKLETVSKESQPSTSELHSPVKKPS